MSRAIEIDHFHKSYGAVTAVADLTLSVEEGELFGLIGPDGAGKTTTMRTLCTLLKPDRGRLLVDGRDVCTDVAYIRGILGYMPQRFSLYPDLSVEQNLNFFADLFGVSKEEKAQRIERLYAFSRLGPFKRRLAQDLSGGMKQKLALSCTLVHTPKILILDEPTTGVDPVSRKEFWEILQQLQREGVTILLSTPYMDEAGLCDRVAFMHQGRILALDNPARLTRLFPYHLYEVSATDRQALVAYFLSETDAVSVQTFGDRLHVSFRDPLPRKARDRIRAQAPCEIQEINAIEPSVEDTFLTLMNRESEENG
ncbi:MAG: ABC transporter ATP-binding protein [Calditrichaeota bacterium]|nr:MAG: ABC transporter ATP-binding protein [Calditrichota bacterium]